MFMTCLSQVFEIVEVRIGGIRNVWLEREVDLYAKSFVEIHSFKSLCECFDVVWHTSVYRTHLDMCGSQVCTRVCMRT